jgi:hypothetical protein
VVATASATYAWSVENGTLESGQGARAITFRAKCTGTFTLRVTVTAAGCPGTGSRTVTVVAPSVTVTAAR